MRGSNTTASAALRETRAPAALWVPMILATGPAFEEEARNARGCRVAKLNGGWKFQTDVSRRPSAPCPGGGRAGGDAILSAAWKCAD